jgi:hypothetical protein
MIEHRTLKACQAIFKVPCVLLATTHMFPLRKRSAPFMASYAHSCSALGGLLHLSIIKAELLLPAALVDKQSVPALPIEIVFISASWRHIMVGGGVFSV